MCRLGVRLHQRTQEPRPAGFIFSLFHTAAACNMSRSRVKLLIAHLALHTAWRRQRGVEDGKVEARIVTAAGRHPGWHPHQLRAVIEHILPSRPADNSTQIQACEIVWCDTSPNIPRCDTYCKLFTAARAPLCSAANT